MDTFLAVASLAISIGGFIPVFFLHDRKKEIVIAIVIASLVCLSGIAMVRQQHHKEYVEKISADIVDKIGNKTQTFDQLYEQLYYVEFPALNEAIDSLVDKGLVDHKILELRGDDGNIHRVRGYFVR